MAIRPTTRTLSQEYGVWNPNYKYNHHAGRDYGCPTGDPVRAPISGKVVEYNTSNAGAFQGYGKTMRMLSRFGFEHWFSHLSAKAVPNGNVKQGQTIARSGNTGWSTAPHLHHEVRWRGMPVHPELWRTMENEIVKRDKTIQALRKQISNQAQQIKALNSAVTDLEKRPTQTEIDAIKKDLDTALKQIDEVEVSLITKIINSFREWIWTLKK